jgi:polar amino acid transport system permease protein
MNEWQTIWEARELFLAGFLKTIYLFIVSSIIGMVIGLCLLYLLELNHRITHQVVRGLVNVMRTLPFLILAYLLYYGLPQMGWRMEADTAGLIALSLYHGAYFCEILRGQRLVMSKGLIEAAQAHGFKHYQVYVHIILPNILLSSLPLLANQLIICLKDTAFLCIITVQEITAASNSVQSTYFIPFKAFLVAILLYWVVGLLIEYGSHLIGRLGRKKGLYHA